MGDRAVLRSDTSRDAAACTPARVYGAAFARVTLTYDCIARVPSLLVRYGSAPPDCLVLQLIRVLQLFEVLCHRCALGLEPSMPDLRGGDWPDAAMVSRYERWCERLTSDHGRHRRWAEGSSEWLKRYGSCFKELLRMERDSIGGCQCSRFSDQLFLTFHIYRVAVATPSLVPHIDPLPNLPNYVFPDPRYP